MGNCVRRETGYEIETEKNTSINPDEIIKRINERKRFWKNRKEKQEYYKSVNVKKEHIISEINRSDEENSYSREITDRSKRSSKIFLI